MLIVYQFVILNSYNLLIFIQINLKMEVRVVAMKNLKKISITMLLVKIIINPKLSKKIIIVAQY